MLLLFLSVASLAMLGAAFGQEQGEIDQESTGYVHNKHAFVLVNEVRHHRVFQARLGREVAFLVLLQSSINNALLFTYIHRHGEFQLKEWWNCIRVRGIERRGIRGFETNSK